MNLSSTSQLALLLLVSLTGLTNAADTKRPSQLYRRPQAAPVISNSPVPWWVRPAPQVYRGPTTSSSGIRSYKEGDPVIGRRPLRTEGRGIILPDWFERPVHGGQRSIPDLPMP
jgi:hypothetical protein